MKPGVAADWIAARVSLLNFKHPVGWRRRFIAVLLGVALGIASLRAATVSMPPITGELSGDFTVLQVPGKPTVAWKARAKLEGGAWRFELVATAPGLAVRAEATPSSNGAPGRWRIVEGTMDLAAWRPLLLTHALAPALPPDLEVEGTAVVGGAGEWRGRDVTGVLTFSLAKGRARSAAQDWRADDIVVDGEIILGPDGLALHSVELSIGTIQAATITAHRLAVAAVGGEHGQLDVRRAGIDALGGHIELTPFVVDPAAPEVQTTAELGGVALGDLATLLPEALSAASGQMEGRISVRWSARMGFDVDAGALTVADNAPADLRLTASPGFLTGKMPLRIQFLPPWLGPLARWVAIDNPAYDMLHRIEMGETWLTIERLRVQLYPDGPNGARSAVVDIAARPAGGGVVDRVTFAVNVFGPLSQVVRLGLNQTLKVSGSMR